MATDPNMSHIKHAVRNHNPDLQTDNLSTAYASVVTDLIEDTDQLTDSAVQLMASQVSMDHQQLENAYRCWRDPGHRWGSECG